MIEKWKTIKGYEKLYHVSSKGRIKRLALTHYSNNERLLNLFLRNGYPSVRLCKEGKITNLLVHRIVADSFIGIIPIKYQVNHKDGNKKNNNVENLEIITSKENHKHAADNRLTAIGEKQHLSRLKTSEIKNIRNAYNLDGLTLEQLAQKYKVHLGTIWQIVNRKTWRHI